MRGLTKLQKQILDKAFLQGASDVDSLPAFIWERLEEVNDYETLFQDTNMYLSDKFWESLHAEQYGL